MATRVPHWQCAHCRWGFLYRPVGSYRTSGYPRNARFLSKSPCHDNVAPENQREALPARPAHTAHHPDLPPSPFLDPRKDAQRKLHRQPKLRPPPRSELNDGQRKLAYDPYGAPPLLEILRNNNTNKRHAIAQTLASATRSCCITNARLPRSVMIRLGLVTHPETGHPWLAPIDALNDARDVAGHGDADASENPESGGSGDPKSKTKLQNATVPQGASTYVLANRALIADLVRSRTTEVGSAHAKDRRKAWVRLINQGVLERLGSARSKVVCREDMADFILRLLQKGVFQQLTWLARRPERGYFRQCRFPLPHEKEKCSLDDLKVPSKATSVLWLGPSSHVPCDGQGSASTNISASPCLSGGEGDLPWDASSGPKPFARVTTAGAIANRQVPLYNLPALLGPERASELRKSLGPLSNEQFISIKAAQSPLQAQILLLRLQLYVVPLPEWDSECGGQLWPF